MTDFIKTQGIVFLAHLLRRLSDELVRGFETWNTEVGITAPPRTHSTMLVLRERGTATVTQLASALKQSHPLIITWSRQLKALGLIRTSSDPQDGRKTLLSLTPAGEAEIDRIRGARDHIESAFVALMDAAGADVFDDLWRLEEELSVTPFLERLRAATDRVSSGDASGRSARQRRGRSG